MINRDESGINGLRNDMVEEYEDYDEGKSIHGSPFSRYLVYGVNPFWIIGFLVLVIITVVLIFLGRSSDKNIKNHIAELDERIKQLEQRLSVIEDLDQKINGYDKRINEIYHAIKSVKREIHDLSLEIRSLPSITAQKKVTQKRYYVVKRGDTLYSIARKHGLTVKELLRINRMKESSPIRPGQKIYLK
jgi:LysM repeat protein